MELRMKNYWYVLITCIPLVAGAAGNDISKVNGSIHVDAGEVVGDVETVNGSIRIEAGATAAAVETVNGSIQVGDRATVTTLNSVNGGISLGEQSQVSSVETVNGGLKFGAGAQVSGSVSSTNGSILLAKGADVRGKLSNVNGKIVLESAHVGGGLETMSGDITLSTNSRVEGGILVRKRNFNLFNWNGKPPKIVIGPNVVVTGPLKFEQEVELYVSNSAKIGPVSGAKAVSFSGDDPAAATQKVER